MDKNYYDILGISTEATEGEIKSAFRKLARKWHPDVAGNTPDSVEKFKSISEAYDILSDEIKRRRYDALRGILHKVREEKEKNNSENKKQNNEQKETKQTKKESSQNTKEKSEKTQEQQSQSDIDNKAFFTMWDNLIHKSGNKKTQEKYSAKKINGTDITSEINISIEEAMMGTSRTVNILHTEPCPKCHGRKFSNGSMCSVCKGKGETSVHKKLTVKIPEKVKHNSKIRIAQEGNQGLNGGKNGDLYLVVKIENDNAYKFDGLNITKTIPLEPFEAVLGTTVKIKTPDGEVSMKVMPKTSNGQKYRLSKQGLTKDGKTGDMIIVISVEIPKDLTEEEIILYEKLKIESHRNLRETAYGN